MDLDRSTNYDFGSRICPLEFWVHTCLSFAHLIPILYTIFFYVVYSSIERFVFRLGTRQAYQAEIFKQKEAKQSLPFLRKTDGEDPTSPICKAIDHNGPKLCQKSWQSFPCFSRTFQANPLSVLTKAG